MAKTSNEQISMRMICAAAQLLRTAESPTAEVRRELQTMARRLEEIGNCSDEDAPFAVR